MKFNAWWWWKIFIIGQQSLYYKTHFRKWGYTPFQIWIKFDNSSLHIWFVLFEFYFERLDKRKLAECTYLTYVPKTGKRMHWVHLHWLKKDIFWCIGVSEIFEQPRWLHTNSYWPLILLMINMPKSIEDNIYVLIEYYSYGS